MSFSLLTHIKFFFSGGAIVFFLYVMYILLPAYKHPKNKIALYVIGLLFWAMALLGFGYILKVVIDILDLSPHFDVAGHARLCTTFIEMMVVPLMCVSMLTMVRLKVPLLWILALVELPIVVTGIIFAFTGSFLAMDLAVYYSLAYTLVNVFGIITHAVRYHEVLNRTYANTSQRGVTWVVITLLLMLSLLAIWILSRFLFPGLLSSTIYIPLDLIPWIFYSRRILRQNYSVEAMEGYIASDSLLPASDDEEIHADLKTWQEEYFGKAIEDYCHKAENFTNPDLSVVNVAAAIGSNRTYVSRWFKEQGKSFSTYISDIRLEYAQSLLVYSNYNISEVVTMSGFSSVRTFRALFVARFGTTPSDYRNANTLHK